MLNVGRVGFEPTNTIFFVLKCLVKIKQINPRSQAKIPCSTIELFTHDFMGREEGIEPSFQRFTNREQFTQDKFLI